MEDLIRTNVIDMILRKSLLDFWQRIGLFCSTAAAIKNDQDAANHPVVTLTRMFCQHVAKLSSNTWDDWVAHWQQDIQVPTIQDEQKVKAMMLRGIELGTNACIFSTIAACVETMTPSKRQYDAYAQPELISEARLADYLSTTRPLFHFTTFG